jgi:hypothetical protein
LTRCRPCNRGKSLNGRLHAARCYGKSIISCLSPDQDQAIHAAHMTHGHTLQRIADHLGSLYTTVSSAVKAQSTML